jgi:hypothetical protein
MNTQANLNLYNELHFDQCDQIGRIFAIFAQWFIDNFGPLIENYTSSPVFWATFSQTHVVTLILTH